MIHFVIHIIYFFFLSPLLFSISVLPFSSCSQKYLHNYNIRKMAIANPFQELILSRHYVSLPLEKSTYLCGKIQLFCSLCSLPFILIIIPGNKGRRNPPQWDFQRKPTPTCPPLRTLFSKISPQSSVLTMRHIINQKANY